jgi:hypothetical protein
LMTLSALMSQKTCHVSHAWFSITLSSIPEC